MSPPGRSAEGTWHAPRTRDPYREAAEEARGSIERLLASGLVRDRTARVHLAVLWHTALYSRISERVYVEAIAAVAQIPGDVEQRHTRRALKRLHERGVIHWAPSKGRHKQSWVSLDPVGALKNLPLLAPISRTENPADSSQKTRPIRVRKPGRFESENPAASGPPTEKVLREVSEAAPSSATEPEEGAPRDLPVPVREWLASIGLGREEVA